MDGLPLLWKAAVVYTLVVIALRFMGRKTIVELSGADLAIVIMLPEVAFTTIDNHGLWLTVGVIVVLALTYLAIDYLTVKTVLSKYLIAEPLILVEQGRLHYRNLSKGKLTMGELLAAVRNKGYLYLDEVEWAIMEKDGQLSVFPKAPYRPPVVQDFHFTPQDRGLPNTLVLDGRVQSESLAKAGVTAEELERINYTRVEELVLSYVDAKGDLHSWLKDGRYIQYPLGKTAQPGHLEAEPAP